MCTMNFNLYIDDATAQELDVAAKAENQTRNAAVRQAVQEWLARHRNARQWPQEILEWEGFDGMEPFEAQRATLAERSNPFEEL
jgi:predicted transcriptional regulator